MVIAALFRFGSKGTIQVWTDSSHHKARQTQHNQTDNLLFPRMPSDTTGRVVCHTPTSKGGKKMQPQLKKCHGKMQILLGFSLYPQDWMWKGPCGDKTNFPFPWQTQRRLNSSSSNQQNGTTTMSKSKLQTLLLKTPHNGWCFLRGGRQTNRNKAAGAELTPCALLGKYLTCTHARTHTLPFSYVNLQTSLCEFKIIKLP